MSDFTGWHVLSLNGSRYDVGVSYEPREIANDYKSAHH